MQRLLCVTALLVLVGCSESHLPGRPQPDAGTLSVLANRAPRSPIHFMRTRSSRGWGINDLAYHGGPIQRRPGVYLIFWDWTADPDGEAPYLTAFLDDFGASAWHETVTQYFTPTQGSIKKSPKELLGIWRDQSPVPAVPESSDLAAEALRAVAHFRFDTNASYIIATPAGHDSDGFGSAYCAYHGAVNSPLGAVAFVDLPYMPDGGFACGAYAVNSGGTGVLDGVSIIAGHELAEAETDPQLDAWFDQFGQEIGDKCVWQNLADVRMSHATFAVQSLWSNDANGGAGGCTLAFKP